MRIYLLTCNDTSRGYTRMLAAMFLWATCRECAIEGAKALGVETEAMHATPLTPEARRIPSRIIGKLLSVEDLYELLDSLERECQSVSAR